MMVLLLVFWQTSTLLSTVAVLKSGEGRPFFCVVALCVREFIKSSCLYTFC